jgi:N-6 DNA Methylase
MSSVRTLLQASSRATAQEREHRGIEALRSLGWPAHAVQGVHGNVGNVRLLEVATAYEPRALLVFTEAASDGLPVSLAYSREAPFTLWWHPEGIGLLETTRWDRYPGDLPLLRADADDAAAAEDIFSLLAPESVTTGRPSLYAEGGRRRDELHETLGNALAELRLQVAQAGVYASANVDERDTSLLRLFHQMLFARFQEDRGRPASSIRIPMLLDSPHPQELLAQALREYGERLNSELFADPGLDVLDLPANSLRRVAAAMVEPWERLRLNFSISRAEIAGRLYQSYLRRTPSTEESDRESQRALFPVVASIDQREKAASYYTPEAVARELARQTLLPWLLENAPSRPEDVRVLDPACGSGAFLIAAYRVLVEYFEDRHGGELPSKDREEILRRSIFGADADPRALGLTQVQLLEEAHLDQQPLPKLEQNLFQGDSLLAPPGADAAPGAIPWGRIVEHQGPFQVVLGNPPFGAQVSLPRRLPVVARREARDRFPAFRAWGSDYAYLFLALALELRADGGAVGLVLPRTMLDGRTGQRIRSELARHDVATIVDCRGLRLFPDVGAYVALVTLRPSTDTEVIAVKDSRADPGLVLEELGWPEVRTLTTTLRVEHTELAREAERGWGAFRLRWFNELAKEVRREVEPLTLPSGRGVSRRLVQGTQPGDLKRFVFARDAWREITRGQEFVVEGQAIPAEHLPRLARAQHIRPFMIEDSGARLFVPFTNDRTVPQGDVKALLDEIGGLPANAQPGDLETLRGPKVLIRAFGREPAAVADRRGEWMTLKGTAGALALRLERATQTQLAGAAALLNSALYQWLLHGFGRPRSDETVELMVSDVAELPWPTLSMSEWRDLSKAGKQVASGLHEKSAIARIEAYRRARRELDQLTFDLLEVSKTLRAVVLGELTRLA